VARDSDRFPNSNPFPLLSARCLTGLGCLLSYGKKGDVDSTKLPAQRLEIDQTVKDAAPQRQNGGVYSDLLKLKALRDAGIISEAEPSAKDQAAWGTMKNTEDS